MKEMLSFITTNVTPLFILLALFLMLRRHIKSLKISVGKNSIKISEEFYKENKGS